MRFLGLSTIAICLSLSAQAIDNPPRRVRDYQANPMEKVPPEPVVRVKTAKVTYANYSLLEKDFPVVRQILKDNPLARAHELIDQWILEHAGYIAKAQAMSPDLQGIQTAIDYEIPSYPSPKAFRPDSYRRGLIFDTGDGILDGKGFGAQDARASARANRNGLMPRADGLRESIYTLGLEDSFLRNGAPYSMALPYAEINWGFQMKDSGGKWVPAVGYLRQAHLRTNWNFNSNIPKDKAIEVELYLRKRGLTSCGISAPLRAQGWTNYDVINIQGRVMANGRIELVDVGAFTRVPRGYVFTKPLAVRENRPNSNVRSDLAADSRMESRQGILTQVMTPQDPAFVHHAESEDEFPPELWAVPNENQIYPEFDRITLSAEAAVDEYERSLAAGKTAQEARQILDRVRVRYLKPGAGCGSAFSSI
ncbi:MAG: hypothetical protein ACXVBW_01635 [Bdellovibrionota bacterium]